MKYTTKDLTKLVKSNYVNLHYVTKEYACYHITDGDNHVYQFTVPLDDIGNGILKNRDKAIFFMRWIRKAIENDEFICVMHLTLDYNEA